MDAIDYQKYIQQFADWAIVFVPKMLLAGIVLWVGLWLAKRFNQVVRLSLEKANVSKDVAPILSSMVDIGVKVVLIFVVAGMVGIQTASFVAMLAAAGFAIGLALQGSLGNFAAGLLIIFFKPYRVGDLVEIENKFGEVTEVQIFNTQLITPGRKKLIIPNGKVIEGVVTNFSTLGITRMELSVTVPYDQDYPQIERIIRSALALTPNVLAEPIPEVGIEALDAHGVRIAVRPYVKPEHYWQSRFDVNRHVKNAFHLNNIPVAVTDSVGSSVVGA